MRRGGTITLVLFAFVAGFVTTYSCGGGSSAGAAGDADTLQGHPASDFAYSTHPHIAGDITGGVLDISLIPSHSHVDFAESSHIHPGLPTGIHWISSPEFVSNYDALPIRNTIYPAPGYSLHSFSLSAFGPLTIPFKCTITEVQFKARDNSDTENLVFEVHDGYVDTVLDKHVPIASADTSGWTSTMTKGIFSTGSISHSYDPTNFEYDRPWWVRIYFNDEYPDHRFYWARIFYTIP